MTCIAVTRGGFGTILRFESDRVAFVHPVVQYGDAIIREASDLPDLYNRIEWPKLMRLAGVTNQLLLDAIDHLSLIEERAARVDSSPRIWGALMALAKDPPDTLPDIAAMVAADRTFTDKKENPRMAIENTNEAEKVTRKSTGDFAPDTVIHYGADKEGVPWSAERSPYKLDSKRSERWAKVRDGMTVQEVVDAGLPASKIGDMVERGFITLHPVAAQMAA